MKKSADNSSGCSDKAENRMDAISFDFAGSCAYFRVMLYPLCKTFYLAFQNYNPTTPYANGFAGFGNFIKLFSKGEFYSSLLVSLKWVVALVILQLIFGMIVALILNQNFKGRGFFRALVLFHGQCQEF